MRCGLPALKGRRLAIGEKMAVTPVSAPLVWLALAKGVMVGSGGSRPPSSNQR
jgi:hypothetical protein